MKISWSQVCEVWPQSWSDWPQIGQMRDLVGQNELKSDLKNSRIVPFDAKLTISDLRC